MPTAPLRPRYPARSTALAALTAVLVLASAGVALAHNGLGLRGRHGIGGTVTAKAADGFTLTHRSGKQVVVHTTAATTFLRTAAATVADAAVGTYVAVKGRTGDDGSITAKSLHVKPAPAAGAKATPDQRRKGGKAAGTVTSNDGSTVVITTASGASVTVHTTAATKVWKTSATDLAGLAVGDRVDVKGTKADDGSVTARAVHIKPAKVVVAATTSSTTSSATSSTSTTAVPGTLTPVSVAPKPAAGGPARAAGTVTAVAAPSFTLASRGGPLQVTTGAGTTFLKTADATLASATVGSAVSVAGMKGDGGTLTAMRVRIHAAAGEDIRDGWCDEGDRALSGSVTAVDPAAGTLTLATAKGPVTVTVHPGARITATTGATFADVATGVRAKATGVRNADGSLAAASVHIDATTGKLAGEFHRRHHGDGDDQGEDADDRQQAARTRSARAGGDDREGKDGDGPGSRSGGGERAGAGGGRGGHR